MYIDMATQTILMQLIVIPLKANTIPRIMLITRTAIANTFIIDN